MAIRWIAAAIAATTFLIVGFFVVVALRGPADRVVVRDSTAIGGSQADQAATRRIGRFAVTAATSLRSGNAEIALSIRDERGDVTTSESVPSAVLQMSGMETIPIALQKASPGNWHGSGRPSMSGRWLFIVTIEGEQASVPIDIP